MISVIGTYALTRVPILFTRVRLFSPGITPGYWRLLDLDYRDQVFQRVLTLLEEEDWSYRRVPLNAACQKLEELEPG